MSIKTPEEWDSWPIGKKVEWVQRRTKEVEKNIEVLEGRRKKIMDDLRGEFL